MNGMEKILVGLLTIWLGLWPVVSWADSDDGGHDKSPDEVIQNIVEAQGVNDDSEIDCRQVTDEQFNALGDAVMSVMAGNGGQHEMMDNMMGGEGSDSLRAMHINMGQRNLGCAGDASGMGMMGGNMGMMNNMMGSGMGQAGGMMGQAGNMFGLGSAMGLGGGGGLVIWVLVVVGIVLFIVWLKRQQNGVSSNKTAIDVLKERYAKGEIEKEEFETKRKDLIND